MTEGLRIAPAYFDARSRSPAEGPPAPYETCKECREKMPAEIRQQRACGFEPPIERPTGVWMPEACRIGTRPALTMCAAYTTALPEVQETIGAHAQWKQGTLTEYLDGEPPTRTLLDRLTAFEAGINEHQADEMRAATKKGGG